MKLNHATHKIVIDELNCVHNGGGMEDVAPKTKKVIEMLTGISYNNCSGNLRSVLIFVYSKTLVKKYQCGIMRIVKLAVGYIVFEQKQIVILADEKSAAEWRRLVCRFMYWEIQS